MRVLRRILVVNAGSSSVKIRLLDGDILIDKIDLDADRGRPEPAELTAALRRYGPVDAVGHRVVHGGRIFTGPALVDDAVRRELAGLVPLAPLHQAPALAALDDTSALLPGVPAVACFDTAFHAGLPAAASTYAVPARWRNEFGVRRYGFHGLAHEWSARRTAALAPGARRVVIAHLGSGASLCAVAVDGGGDGEARVRSVDTTMGFTPTAGLVMGTRCGDLDPAVPLWLVEHAGLAVSDVAAALDHGSGLLGLAGVADMRAVLAAERAGRPDAVLAVEVWLHRLRAGIAAMAAALGGLDALVFSAGIGEHQPELRRRALDGLGFLGLRIDPAADAAVRDDADADVTAAGAAARTLVVHAREDLVIARGVRAALGQRTVPASGAGRRPGRSGTGARPQGAPHRMAHRGSGDE